MFDVLPARGIGSPSGAEYLQDPIRRSRLVDLADISPAATREPVRQDDERRHGTHPWDGITNGSDLLRQGRDWPGRRDTPLDSTVAHGVTCLPTRPPMQSQEGRPPPSENNGIKPWPPPRRGTPPRASSSSGRRYYASHNRQFVRPRDPPRPASSPSSVRTTTRRPTWRYFRGQYESWPEDQWAHILSHFLTGPAQQASHDLVPEHASQYPALAQFAARAQPFHEW
ncbi:unnamed protein product [Boreogadus saida]